MHENKNAKCSKDESQRRKSVAQGGRVRGALQNRGPWKKGANVSRDSKRIYINGSFLFHGYPFQRSRAYRILLLFTFYSLSLLTSIFSRLSSPLRSSCRLELVLFISVFLPLSYFFFTFFFQLKEKPFRCIKRHASLQRVIPR